MNTNNATATITLPRDLVDKLTALAQAYTTQDNCSTAFPIYFTVNDTVQLPAPEDGYDATPLWLHDGESTGCTTLDELRDSLPNWVDEDELAKLEAMSDDELEDWLEDNDYRLVYQQPYERHQNVFLTTDACREHIQRNHYHYSNDARAYCQHAWRNPEMELISQLLRAVAEQVKLAQLADEIIL